MPNFRLKSLPSGTEEDEPQNTYDGFPESTLQRSQPHHGLKQVRKAAKLTQKEMALETGVSRKSYQLYETGKLPIPSDKVVKLAQRFDFDIHKFFTGSPLVNPVQLKVQCAQVGIDAFKELLRRFDDTEMTMDEMKRIAMAYAKYYTEGDGYSYMDLLKCVELVTGYKYVPDPNDPDLWGIEDEKPH